VFVVFLKSSVFIFITCYTIAWNIVALITANDTIILSSNYLRHHSHNFFPEKETIEDGNKHLNFTNIKSHYNITYIN
jgi:hypothetical protein